ncbi:hypothetical protein GCM10023223_30080 [Stackebrandtia albiflava]
MGTYGRYGFGDLPPVPFPMTGDLSWLADRPVSDEWSVAGNASESLPSLREACARAAVTLPPAFDRFMATSSLQRRVRSNTACFIDLDTGPVASPVGGGHLIRFLSDQQGCLFWYLHDTEGGDHAVVCSPDFHGTDAEPGPCDPEAICFCAETFEVFLCRFWLENEVWFATTDGTPLPDVATEYIARYREVSA